eukprot:TRINITY_DN1098_c0_g1_i3.p1 TRINITY_DN1098_c0_g1~~TRINITY_DN1098_c0_g1_i3.p1  ORF type:complete len:355 (-),score=67.68 TRINITY_DN1098_c0_g1_i3:227-1291(-)
MTRILTPAVSLPHFVAHGSQVLSAGRAYLRFSYGNCTHNRIYALAFTHFSRRNRKRNVVFSSAGVGELQADKKDKTEKIIQMSADWEKAKYYRRSGQIFEGKVDGSNSGGLLVRFNNLQGFLPFSQMSPAHFPKGDSKSVADMAKELIGSTLSLEIIEVNEEERSLIFSEKKVLLSKFADQTKVGDVLKGRISAVTNFGAFVDLLSPDGTVQVNGMVHVSEVSWDLVQDARDVLREGEDVQVKVIHIDLEKSRLSLSIKQLQSDPLFETLESVLPQEAVDISSTSAANDDVPNEPLPGLEKICQELLLEEGISTVKIGRQAIEKRVVSQDLELWLSNAGRYRRCTWKLHLIEKA